MSGIGGIWSMAGDGAERHIAILGDHLRQRGPDRTGRWDGRSMTLVHCLLATTPEAETEIQPVSDAQLGLTIVADVRLDNRASLLADLAPGRDGARIGDAELILLAYRRWQDDYVLHLLGDFAFVIVDPRREAMVCARDHLGMRQLLYHHVPGRLFAFASEPDALAALPFVPGTLNDERVADFLDNLEGSSFTSTFYRTIHRLEPGHRMIVTADGLRRDRYWSPRPQPTLRLPSDQAYADAFLAVFTEAVRCRLRSNGPVGAMLSGGTDSSATAAVAMRLLRSKGEVLKTFSAVGPDPDVCAETMLVHRSAQAIGSDATMVDHSALEPDDVRLLAEQGHNALEPFDSTSMLNRAVYLAAHKAGVRVVFDAAAADTMLSAGNRVAALLAAGRIVSAWREAQGHAAFWGEPPTRRGMMTKGFWVAFAPYWMRRALRLLRGRMADADPTAALGHLKPSFVASSALERRRKDYRRFLDTRRPFGAEYLARVLSHPNIVVGRERYDRIASRLAIEPRDAFMDVRVVEFCLSLPPEQFQDAGIPKPMLRRALADLVPPEVAWRRGKSHLGPQYLAAIVPDPGDGALVPQPLARFVREPRNDPSIPMGWYRYEWKALTDWLTARALD